MARSSGSGGAAAAASQQRQPAAAAAAAADQLQDLFPPEKVDLDDAQGIKHRLDSTAADVILLSGYEEDHLISNVKITLGLIAILVALYSHFGPGKFPANAGAVAYCVAAYVLLNAVLLIFSTVKEGDSFLTTHPKIVS